jgi:hypothetical protein
MQHDWAKSDLEDLVGQSESLVLEFKRQESLLATSGKDHQARFDEAARDVAAMANEAGGTIIYGIDEDEIDGVRRAAGVGRGFSSTERIERERFLQAMSSRIQPPIAHLDAQDVDLGGGYHAIIVEVPQARGRAHQTLSDYLFWRRDAQGRRKMTAQEIEDVRGRTDKPVLELQRSQSSSRPNDDGSGWELHCNLLVHNASAATATFAVLTVGLVHPNSATWLEEEAWQRHVVAPGWDILRTVIASGSSPRWSPITPDLAVPLPPITLHVPQLPFEPAERSVGFARLDHDGGSRSYRIFVSPHYGFVVSLEPFTLDTDQPDWQQIPSVLVSPPH